MSRFVRLRPFDRRRGHLLRRYIFRSQKFVAGNWYEVQDGMGDELSTVLSRDGDDESPLAFDVFDTKEEALAFVHAERKAKAKATAESPELVGVMTSSDLDEDAATKAAMAKRAEDNLQRAKAKRAEEREKSDRQNKRARDKKKVEASGGGSPADAKTVPDPEAPQASESGSGKDPFED